MMRLDNASKNYFLPYQLEWITDESSLKIYEKSRRIGITYGTSYRSVRKCLRQSDNSKFVQWVASRDELTAKEFITDYVAMWAKAANVVAKGLQGDWIEVVDEKKGIKTFVVEFANGSRIVSLSSNPYAFAGKGGDILLDEFDLHGDQGKLYDMAFPCTTWGGQLEIVSAYDPDGSEHTVFAQLAKECRDLGNPKGFKLHSTTLSQAVEQGFVEKVNEVKRRKGRPTQTREAFVEGIKKSCRTLSAYLSQYECVPNSASGQQAVRPNDLTNGKKDYAILRVDVEGDGEAGDIIDPVTEPFVETSFWKANIPKFERYAMGYDVARKRDLAAIWIDGIKADHYTLLCLMTFQNCKFESQKLVAEAVMEALGAVGAGDETGMGGPNCEYLATKYGERFAPVNFASLKLTLGTTLMEVFEQGRQTIPLDPPEIGADIAGIRKDASSSNGKLVFTEAKNPFNPLSHCDMGWACALAKHAGQTIDAAGPCAAEPAGTGDECGEATNSFLHPDHSDDFIPTESEWCY